MLIVLIADRQSMKIKGSPQRERKHTRDHHARPTLDRRACPHPTAHPSRRRPPRRACSAGGHTPHLAMPALHEAVVRTQPHPLLVPRALPRVRTFGLREPRKSKATGGDESILVILHLIYVILFFKSFNLSFDNGHPSQGQTTSFQNKEGKTITLKNRGKITIGFLDKDKNTLFPFKYYDHDFLKFYYQISCEFFFLHRCRNARAMNEVCQTSQKRPRRGRYESYRTVSYVPGQWLQMR